MPQLWLWGPPEKLGLQQPLHHCLRRLEDGGLLLSRQAPVLGRRAGQLCSSAFEETQVTVETLVSTVRLEQ